MRNVSKMALFLILFHKYLLNTLGLALFVSWIKPQEEKVIMYSTKYDWRESNKHGKKVNHAFVF